MNERIGTEPPTGLLQHWVHSFEEDSPGATVYRPDGFAFPPARGRRGMEFAEGGVFVDHPLGRGDAPDSVRGRWRMSGEARVSVSFPGTGRAGRELVILACDEKVLRVAVA
ncbi:hypothetical protein [Streptomyces albireticuli]|uniref:Uncharacterized protein n=1 Tax=Streptomyces albireticuli TaxID=1940 RepID=A0A2A2DCP3_9ACTN|nr:hypothetical protein [Streptomyces albireticuli]MCD9140646.1 hypothetical protein [Streptomyces albireticuli]MCD9161392.1 hypothetical protein [Streptomyces albireticuli]MCD9193038.1 hypothetical protein [Streptomyces albireticuli]PAU49216.1 hypothetical protein CK936_09070 [Streptomyces albireticuli]